MANKNMNLEGQSNKWSFSGDQTVNPFPEGKKAEGILQEQHSVILVTQHYII
jgi:hypothetical protein